LASLIYLGPRIANAAKGFIDLHKVNIHYDRKLTIEPAVDGRNQHRSGSIVVPFKLQNLTFESDLLLFILRINNITLPLVIMLMAVFCLSGYLLQLLCKFY